MSSLGDSFYKDGIKEGIKEGIILGEIATLLSIGQEEDAVVKRIMKRYGLSGKEAMRYLEESRETVV